MDIGIFYGITQHIFIITESLVQLWQKSVHNHDKFSVFVTVYLEDVYF